jgi:hypothetical protein
MRTALEALVTERALHFISSRHNPDLVDAIVDHADFLGTPSVLIKNVCAKVSVRLSDSIDEVCALLGVQKRRFLEAAFMEAVERAHAIIEAEGVYELLTHESKASKSGEVA